MNRLFGTVAAACLLAGLAVSVAAAATPVRESVCYRGVVYVQGTNSLCATDELGFAVAKDGIAVAEDFSAAVAVNGAIAVADDGSLAVANAGIAVAEDGSAALASQGGIAVADDFSLAIASEASNEGFLGGTPYAEADNGGRAIANTGGVAIANGCRAYAERGQVSVC